jgi:pectinesterase
MHYDAIVDQRFTGAEGEAGGQPGIYRTVQNAVHAAPAEGTQPYRIFIRSGTYYEKLEINKPFIHLIGEKAEETILTYDAVAGKLQEDGTPYGSMGSASVTISGSDFAAEQITFENSFDFPANEAKEDSDPTKLEHTQALALKTVKGNDRARFRSCRFLGYHDTLLVHAGTQYFENCRIAGHVDFIYGAGRAVFERCEIVAMPKLKNDYKDYIGFITGACTPLSENFGILFLNCRLTKGSPDIRDGSMALGRPWHPTTTFPDGTRAADPHAVASVVYMNCEMDSHISVEGWTEMHGWDKDRKIIYFYAKDSRFAEYGNTGPGAHRSPSRPQLTDEEASRCTPSLVLNGWDPTAV